MQFIADMCKSLREIGSLNTDDLYSLSEEEVINKFINCKDEYLKRAWNNFVNSDKVYTSNSLIEDKYCINIKTKTRYVNPLVKTSDGNYRISDLSKVAKECIDNYLSIPKEGYYTYFDFDFKPYTKVRRKNQ